MGGGEGGSQVLAAGRYSRVSEWAQLLAGVATGRGFGGPLRDSEKPTWGHPHGPLPQRNLTPQGRPRERAQRRADGRPACRHLAWAPPGSRAPRATQGGPPLRKA